MADHKSKGSRLFTEYANMVKGFKTVEQKLMTQEAYLKDAAKNAKHIAVKLKSGEGSPTKSDQSPLTPGNHKFSRHDWRFERQ
jgi:hypothetical protein